MLVRKTLALAVMSAFLLGSLPVTAQEDATNAVLRMTLPSPIFFTGTPPDDDEEELPPGGGTNNGPVVINPGTDFRTWATVGDGFGPLVITGGTPPYVTSLASGNLPHGLSIGNNAIDGFYGSSGLYTFTLKAIDSSNPVKQDESDAITVEVADPLFIANYPQSTYQATVGVQWSAPAPAVWGGTPSYSYSASGIAVDDTTGQMSLMPSSTGSHGPFSLAVGDAHDRTASTAPITVNVSDPLTAAYSPATYTFRLNTPATIPAPVVAGGRGAKSFVVASGPAGLAINPTTGVLSGTPTTAGSGTLSTTASDVDTRTATATANWTVNSQPFAVTGVSASYNASAGSPFTGVTPATTGQIGSVTWQLASGSLPAGLSLSPTTGAISGTPTTSQTSSGLSLQATDSLGTAISNSFSIAVSDDHVATVAENAINIDLPGDYFTAAEWFDNKPKRLVIPAGVTVYSQLPALPALTTGSGYSGTLTIENYGNIYGAGGIGSGTGVGGQGGTAIFASTTTVTILNYGNIFGGGGGGGLGGKGGDAGGYNAGTYSATQINSGTPAYYCYKSAGSSGPYTQTMWNGTSLGSSNTATFDKLTGAGSPYRYSCGTSGSYYFNIKRALLTFTASATGGAGGRGGDGQGFTPAQSGAPGSAGGPGAGAGGQGGAGGSFGIGGSAGANGVSSGQQSGLSGFGGGNAGYGIQGVANYSNLGGQLKGQ